jgi:peptidoglycan/xylan/chitin deacetylase (PgdA/CDA1 family)
MWDVPLSDEEAVYITFDDGPHPTVTPFVLAQLRLYNADATFFCVGNNVARYPAVYNEILNAGHTTGNHTFNHSNGWRTANGAYLRSIRQASNYVGGYLFRPPYGRMKLSQYRKLKKTDKRWKVWMWDILSGDFDKDLSPQQCINNVLEHIKPGSVIVFHDSEKAWDRMHIALPAVLAYCADKHWKMKVLPQGDK